MAQMAEDEQVRRLARELFLRTVAYRYSYNFSWLGRPVIQYPEDLMAMQELVWQVQPDLILETGIAHGGSLIFYASLLEMLGRNGHVLGIDVEIRPHNRVAIEAHPMVKRITVIEGSSVEDTIAAKAHELARGRRRVVVVLDSSHTHQHVLRELELYSPLVKSGGYIVVFDTVIEDMPAGSFPDRPWDKGNNPKTAVREFLRTTDRFEIDREIQNKLLLTVAPDGYLKCVRD
jgi:cephalosporin hydroxylase